MDKFIGRYRVSMEDVGLILTHPTGISFDLTPDEVVKLMEFISVYQDAIAKALRDTEPRVESIATDEEPGAPKREASEHKLPNG